MVAAIIGTNLGYIALAFLPPILWLAFYLREDCHPEPKRLIILAFVGGTLAAVAAIFAEIFAFQFVEPRFDTTENGNFSMFFFLSSLNFRTFLIIGLIEEYLKYAAVKFFILRKHDFNEPVDAMIYMMTAALGFAAFENVLFLLPNFQESVLLGLQVTTSRFLGANLLHALASGVVGFFLARAFFSPWRKHFIAVGIILASILHAVFNYLIIVREILPQGIFYLALLLSTMLIIVLADFRRLRGFDIKTPTS